MQPIVRTLDHCVISITHERRQAVLLIRDSINAQARVLSIPLEREQADSLACLLHDNTTESSTSNRPPLEIERKFIVQNFVPPAKTVFISIEQAYLSVNPFCTVRIRTQRSPERAFFTVKGITKQAAREEFEITMPFLDAHYAMRTWAVGNILKKDRYSIKDPNYPNVWEIDVFHGEHLGLTLAEVELPSVNAPYAFPACFQSIREVTEDNSYSNAMLACAKP